MKQSKKYIQSVPIMYHLYHYLEYEKSISSPKNAYFDLSEISQGSSLYAVATEQAKSKQLAEAASIEIMPEDWLLAHRNEKVQKISLKPTWENYSHISGSPHKWAASVWRNIKPLEKKRVRVSGGPKTIKIK